MQPSLTSISANRRRRVLLGAGVATLALSLALSIAPALAKNSGTVKIHDAEANTDIDASLNDPQVCTFTVVFEYTDPAEAGTWQILSWAPTGDGSQVATGTYDTAASGPYETDVLTLDAGHYRLEWAPTGSRSSRNKTFWVKCSPAGDTGDESSPSPSGDPNAGSQAGDSRSVSGDQNTDGQSSGTTDNGTTDNGTTDNGTTDNGTADNGTADSGTADQGQNDQGNGAVDDNGTDTSGTDTSGTDTSNQSPASDPGTGASGSEQGAQNETPGASQEGDVKGITSPVNVGGRANLPNTAFKVPTQSLSGLLTVIGLLLVIAAHPFMRRSAHADRA